MKLASQPRPTAAAHIAASKTGNPATLKPPSGLNSSGLNRLMAAAPGSWSGLREGRQKASLIWAWGRTVGLPHRDEESGLDSFGRPSADLANSPIPVGQVAKLMVERPKPHSLKALRRQPTWPLGRKRWPS